MTRQTNDRLHAIVQSNPNRFAALAISADTRSRGRGRRTGTLRHQARLQGCDDPRPHQRPLHRRQALLADLRTRRSARRAALHAPVASRTPMSRRLITTTTSASIRSCLDRRSASPWKRQRRACALCSAACSRNIPASRSSWGISAKPFRSCSGASISRCRGLAIAADLSRRPSASISI